MPKETELCGGKSVQRTLTITKPDAVLMGNEDGIEERYKDKGLRLVEKIEFQFTPEQAGEFYIEHEGKFFYAGLKLALSSGPCVVYIWERENAIEVARVLNGATDPAKALPGTLRFDYRSAGGPFNTVHSSDSEEAVEIEVSKVHAFSNTGAFVG